MCKVLADDEVVLLVWLFPVVITDHNSKLDFSNFKPGKTRENGFSVKSIFLGRMLYRDG
jgi:hypothetical protein